MSTSDFSAFKRVKGIWPKSSFLMQLIEFTSAIEKKVCVLKWVFMTVVEVISIGLGSL